MRVLKNGVNGEEVRLIQAFLGLSPDGKFGSKTKSAVIRWQSNHGLKADGIAGMKTIASMQKGGLHISSSFKPKGREAFLPESDIRAIIEANNGKLVCDPNKNNPSATSFDPEENVIAVAIRGFKLDTMGSSGRNDRRIYDDAHFIVTPRGMVAYNGNTDPNGYRKGYGKGSSKGMAMLDEGVWFFGKGAHRGRPAFRQACPFRVIRDGNPPYPDTGYHAINWHDGGSTSTSSLGCQTNKPNDFAEMRRYIYKAMIDFNNPLMYLDYRNYGKQPVIPYILIDEVERRKGNLIV